MAGALGDQDLAVDEQDGIVQPGGRGPRYPLSHRDNQQPGQEGGRDGVDDQDPARAEHPARFPHGRAQVHHVLEDLAGADHIGAAVGQGQDGGVALDRRHAVLGRLHQRGPGEVHSDQPVPQPVDMRGEQAGPAAYVDQHCSRPGGRRDQGRAGLRQPVQHGERSAWIPPLTSQVVILGRVVSDAWRYGCHPPIFAALPEKT